MVGVLLFKYISAAVQLIMVSVLVFMYVTAAVKILMVSFFYCLSVTPVEANIAHEMSVFEEISD